MTERIDRARGLGRQLDPAWRREDVEARLAHLRVRRRARRRHRLVGGALAAAAVAAVAFAGAIRREPAAPARVAQCEVARAPARVASAPPVAEAVVAPSEGSVHVDRQHRVVASEPRPLVHEAPARSEPEPPAAEPPSWRDLAGRGDYAAAWSALAQAAPLASMEDLLLAGDVARMSGHAGAAVAPLARALALHADDPRSPLAAFTLGRVHLEDLGAPRDAALAFARARELAPDGPLAEDALAREVEAWSRAGETETARARARGYLQRYPQGRRVRAVRQFGLPEGP